MRSGLVVGKFWPPHAGHCLLIRTALEQCDHLTVLLVAHPQQQPPEPELRAAWLRELFPAAEVRVVPDIGNDDDSRLWASYTRQLLGSAPDLVFTSEPYGDAYARFLGSQHALVDIDRLREPISGTAVRRDPLGAWRFLPQPVRAHYALRVCVLGAESTGTTTLAQMLAERFATVWVPEYGREYTIEHDRFGEKEWRTPEFVTIAEEQARREDTAARTCERLLVCDTDAFATGIWHERYMGHRSPDVEFVAESRRRPGSEIALYLVTDVDIPFVQDGWRDGEHLRAEMHARFIERLDEDGLRWALISGPPAERLERSTELIAQLGLHAAGT